MSKTDKENKENSAKTDVINTANYEQDFSYPNTIYYKSYTISRYVNQYHIGYNTLKTKCKPFDEVNYPIKIETGVPNINNNNKIEEYIVPNNSNDIKNITTINTSGINTKENSNDTELLDYLLSDKKIEKKLNDDMDTFCKYINNLNTNLDIKELQDVYIYANKSKNQVISRMNNTLKYLDEVDDEFLKNFLISECLYITKDILIENLVPPIELKNTKLYNLIESSRFLSKKEPRIAVLVLFAEISAKIFEFKEKYDKYRNAEKGYKLGQEYAVIEALYYYLSKELAYIYLQKYINNDIFIKTKLSYDSNHLIMYANNSKSPYLVSLHSKNSTYVRDILHTVELNTDNPSHYATSLYSLPHEYVENQSNERRNSICQLSMHTEKDKIDTSVYFHHIKSLIIDANYLTFMQTKDYSSLTIYALLKQGLNGSISNNSDKKNKYTILVSNKIAKENILSLSQKLLSDKHENLAENVVCFYLKERYSIDAIIEEYVKSIRQFARNLSDCMYQYTLNSHKKLYKKTPIVSVLFDIFTSNSIFTYPYGIHYENNFYGDNDNDVYIYNDSPWISMTHQGYYNVIIYSDIFNFFISDVYLKHNEYMMKLKETFYEFIDDTYLRYLNRLYKALNSISPNSGVTSGDILTYLIMSPTEIDEQYNEISDEGIDVELEKKFLKTIASIHSHIISLHNISEQFSQTLSTNSIEKIQTVKKEYKEAVENYFRHGIDELETSYPLLNIVDIKQDNQLKDIYVNTITCLFSEKYTQEKAELLGKIEEYCTQYPVEDFDSLINEIYIKKYHEISLKINLRLFGTNKVDFFVIEEDYCHNLLKDIMHEEISIILPISSDIFSYVCDNEIYYKKLCAAIFLKHLKKDDNPIEYHTYLFDKLIERVNIISLHNIYEYVILVSTVLDYLIDNRKNSKDIDDLNQANSSIISKDKIKTVIKNKEALQALLKETLVYYLFDDKDDFEVTDIVDLELVQSILKKVIEELAFTSNFINRTLSASNFVNTFVYKKIKKVTKAALVGAGRGISYNNIAVSDDVAENGLSDSEKYGNYISKQHYVNQKAAIKRSLMAAYNSIKYEISDNIRILNEDRDAIIKTFKGIRSNVKESLKQNGTQPWGNQLKSLFNNLDYYIGLNATSHNSNKAFGAAKLKTTTEGNKVKKTVNTSAPLTVIVDDYVTDLLDKHIIGKYFKVLNVEEYENKYFAMQYAFMSKRENTPGAEWNASRRYFTLPASINQNFIMSDFRAMVVGGAHFDNNCFVQSRSVGVFIQDNLEVSKSFLEIVTGYLDVVKEQQLDVKMGKYLVAYYKVIYYLYGLKKIQKFNYFYLEMLYRNLSDIKNFIDENDLINQIEKADSENTQNINNNNSQTIDNSLMKDFVIQLKRIGESNYKFYETQKPAKKGQASNNNDNSKGGDVQEAQPVQDNSTATATATATATTTIKLDNMSNNTQIGSLSSSIEDNIQIPVLLGSLIYDENWFKSTIDDE